MKKLFLVLAAAFAMVACQTDINEVGVAADGVATVEFEVGAPQMRAYSNGLSVDSLQYSVYQVKVVGENKTLTHLSSLDGTKPLDGLHTNVQIELANNKKYAVIFWAEDKDAPYEFNRAEMTVTVDYTDAVCNDENRDAFYAYKEFEVKGAAKLGVELRRPFAQVNVGTSDLAEAAKSNFVPSTSALVVKNVCNVLNLVTGEASGGVNAEFGAYAVPTGEAFPVSGHDYLAMSYVLVGKDKGSYDVTYTITAEDDTVINNTIGAVPMQANYRTNIYGNLLTSKTDINVEIKPGYDGTNATEAWDGQTIKEPAYDEATKTYYISCASELAYIAQLVNGTLDTDNVSSRAAVAANSLEGYIVKLVNNIALNGMEWTPIGNGSNHFKGTFEGNHKTISGLKVTKRGDDRAALFGTVSGTVVFRNLTISGAEVRCPDFKGDFYGSALIGTAYGVVTIENVDIVDSYLSGNNKVGALLAHDGVMNVFTVSGCDVSGTTFEATDAEDCGLVGGLVGYFQTGGEHHITNCSVKGCTFNVANSRNNGARANGLLIGGINSKANQKFYINDAVIENNTWNEKFYVDGVEVTEGKFVSPYGGLIGGERDDNAEGELYINNELFVPTNYVYTAEQLAEVVNGATEDITVTFANDLDGAILLKKNTNSEVDVTIDGNNKKFSGKIHICGMGGALSTLTIKNVNFEENGTYASHEAMIYDYVTTGVNNSYTHNLTVENCTFSGTTETVAAIRQQHGGSNNWTIKNCTVNAGVHSMLQVANINSGLVVEGCHVYSKNGANLSQTHEATFTGCEFDVQGYAVRVGANQSGVSDVAEVFNFTNNTLKSACNDGDAVVIVRGTAANATLNFENTTLEGTTKIGGADAGTTTIYIDGELWVPGGYYEKNNVIYILNAEGLAHFSGYTFPKEITEVKLLNNIDMQGAEFAGMANVNDLVNLVFNGNGKTISNIKFKTASHFGMTTAAGLFDSVTLRFDGSSFECKDLTLSNVSFADEVNAKWAGAVIGYAQIVAPDQFKLTRVHVKDSNLKGSASIGGMIGMLATPASLYAQDCSVTKTTIVATEKRAAAYVGIINSPANTTPVVFENCVVGSDVTISAPTGTENAYVGDNINNVVVNIL